MIEEAVKRIQPDDEVVLHSDQGWHYQMSKYQNKLKDLSPVEYRTQILKAA